jgi:DNA-binding beta-propeller fold protein YncE
MQNLSAPLGLRSFLPRRRTAALVGLALLVAGSSFAFLAPIDIKAAHGWGAVGGDSGQFRAPTGIATRSGIIYVLDSYNNRVQLFAIDGTFVNAWPVRKGDTFRESTGIAVDQADGTVYIASNYRGNPRVFKYSSSGAYLDAWGYYGHLDGQFGHVTDIAVGPDSNVYTVDAIRSNVQVFAPDHTFLRSWRVGAQPAAIAVSQDGFVYVAEAGTHLVSKFNLQGVFQFSWPISTLRKSPSVLTALSSW